jgi:hypothetical protein
LKILIIGQPKTGTSALFFKIKNSFPGESKCLFEPQPEEIAAIDVISHPQEIPVLAKVLLLNDGRQWHEYIRRFEKTIFLTRDPRDRLVSALLYSVRDSYRAYMETFEYEDEWKLSATPGISREHASAYVRRLVNQRRLECNKPLFDRPIGA